MSFEADNVEHERSVEERLEQLEVLMAAMVAGIALMNDLTPKQLIELSGV